MLDPSQPKYRHSLGVAYDVAENWQQAVDAFQRAIDKDPFNTKFLMSLVKPLTHLKRFTRVTEVRRSLSAAKDARITIIGSMYIQRGASLLHMPARSAGACVACQAQVRRFDAVEATNRSIR